MSRTPYLETEALLIAADVKGGDIEQAELDEYLSQFLPRELASLHDSAQLLANRAYAVYDRKRANVKTS